MKVEDKKSCLGLLGKYYSQMPWVLSPLSRRLDRDLRMTEIQGFTHKNAIAKRKGGRRGSISGTL